MGGGNCYCSLSALKIKFTANKTRSREKSSRLLSDIRKYRSPFTSEKQKTLEVFTLAP